MKRIAAVLVGLSASLAWADCAAPAFNLEGAVAIEACDPEREKCLDATSTLFEYTRRIPDDPAVVSVALQSSPWRFYGPDMRILAVDELAARIRPQLTTEAKRVSLLGSWTGVVGEAGAKSLADQVSLALDGFPVDGMDGFVWISPQGAVRTTHQAFTMRSSRGPYEVREGDEVMVALAAGWYVGMGEPSGEHAVAEDFVLAGRAWDVFGLCPENALAAFEKGAARGSGVAAYNAAMMRMEQGGSENLRAAIALLLRGSKLGDQKSKEKLQSLRQSK